MKKNIQLFSLALISTVLVFSCKDKDPETPGNNGPGKSRAELLRQKNWKISSLVSGSNDIWSNALFVADCNKDNEYNFRSDDSLVQYDKTKKCSSTDPDSTVSFYKLYNDNTQLILNIKLTSAITLNDTAEILELNESSLKVDTQYSGFPATVTFTHP